MRLHRPSEQHIRFPFPKSAQKSESGAVRYYYGKIRRTMIVIPGIFWYHVHEMKIKILRK